MRLSNIHYVPFSQVELNEQVDDLTRYLHLAAEYGNSKEAEVILKSFKNQMYNYFDQFQSLVLSAKDTDEPDDLQAIRALRPKGPRKLLNKIPEDYEERFLGSFLGRSAGCTLGAAVEFQSVDEMEYWALQFGDDYPMKDYWKYVKSPQEVHYIVGKGKDLTRGNIDSIPPDDDLMYTLLGLFTVEKYGDRFSYEHMAEIWKHYIPIGTEGGMRGVWSGERRMMLNMSEGIKMPEAGIYRNPNIQDIAAWTRADSYAYIVPGWPEKAAELAYRDASINHRRNGIYGSMFMAAAISAAFAVKEPQEALEIALTEIPENCLFAEGVKWAMESKNKIHNYREAADLVWSRYKGMFVISALTNAIFVILGILIGQMDFTKVIGETVAMGGDNDCTGATAGSIVGAVIGKKNIPPHWYRPFQNRLHSYLLNSPEYIDVDDIKNRFTKLAYEFMKN